MLGCKIKEKMKFGEQILYIADVKRACVEEDLFKKGMWTEDAKPLLRLADRLKQQTLSISCVFPNIVFLAPLIKTVSRSKFFHFF